MLKATKMLVLLLVVALMLTPVTALGNHNSGGDGDKSKHQKKCEKALKYLDKSENAKNEKYAEKYLEKYNKYNKYCDEDYNKKCEKALKYLAKSQNAKKEKYAQKYYAKYLKYSKYCPVDPPPNTAPSAGDVSKTLESGKSYTESFADLPGTDAEDASGDLTRVIVDQPSAGTLVDNGDGTYTYTAPATAGTYTFTYKVVDSGGLESAVGTVTITVEDPLPPPNTAPEAGTLSKTLMVGQSYTDTYANLPGNDAEDASGDLTRVIVDQPSAGTLVDNGDGSYTYSAPAAVGVYTFTYKVVDSGGLESAPGTVTITVEDNNAFNF